jgi:hypothetical protein
MPIAASASEVREMVSSVELKRACARLRDPLIHRPHLGDGLVLVERADGALHAGAIDVVHGRADREHRPE